jgi:thiol-disulfide isomerase/thioredoxin
MSNNDFPLNLYEPEKGRNKINANFRLDYGSILLILRMVHTNKKLGNTDCTKSSIIARALKALEKEYINNSVNLEPMNESMVKEIESKRQAIKLGIKKGKIRRELESDETPDSFSQLKREIFLRSFLGEGEI